MESFWHINNEKLFKVAILLLAVVILSGSSSTTIHSPLAEPLHVQWYPVHEISFLVFFLLPVLLLAFLYISMVRAIRQAAQTNLRSVLSVSCN